MRTFLFALFAMTTGINTANAASQQQCEALLKPIEAKMDRMQSMDTGKPTPQACARGAEMIKMYVSYKAEADKLNCPFAFVSGQKVGGAPERAELIADMKKAYSEQCR
ncbi:hypothetical protein [Noviherbaspirillum saxi]|uniref:Uncharacterized protein n=1 Tax=Noviherbaspirillum saxi TaxID=2320863 RepID=A0A3A3FHM2_9BURK|nr:hypothetical protein [Noviherbaspirillum saxi]RJF92660.1 hypothetical protein D3871_29200 [Noviherbaspirillum saxi]